MSSREMRCGYGTRLGAATQNDEAFGRGDGVGEFQNSKEKFHLIIKMASTSYQAYAKGQTLY